MKNTRLLKAGNFIKKTFSHIINNPTYRKIIAQILLSRLGKNLKENAFLKRYLAFLLPIPVLTLTIIALLLTICCLCLVLLITLTTTNFNSNNSSTISWINEKKQEILTQFNSIFSNTNEDENSYEVLNVIDGDTIVINYHGNPQKVRFIGIDAPEKGTSTSPKECFSDEAHQKTKELIGDKRVILKRSKIADKDKYGRLLRYVYTIDGVFINKVLVEEGYASTYPQLKHEYINEFLTAENEAQKNNRGKWNKTICN